MIYCPRCGSSVIGAYCGSCGAPAPAPPRADATVPMANRPSTAVTVPPQSPAAPAPPIRATPAATEGGLPAGRPGRRSGLLVAAGAGTLALVLAGAAWAGGLVGRSPAPAQTVVFVTQTVQPSPPAPLDDDSGNDTSASTTTPGPPPTSTSFSAPAGLQTPPTPPPAVPVTPTSQDAEATAVDALEAMVRDDRAFTPVRGQWVAQLASKRVGTVDTRQQPQPFSASDILAEVQSVRANPEYGSAVRVLHLGDWGGTAAGATPMWVTVVDLDLHSRAEVRSWCEARFPQRGTALLDVCYPRQLLIP